MVFDLRDRGEAGVPDRLRVVAAEAPHELAQSRVGHHREVRAGVARIDLPAPRTFEQRDGLPRCRRSRYAVVKPVMPPPTTRTSDVDVAVDLRERRHGC